MFQNKETSKDWHRYDTDASLLDSHGYSNYLKVEFISADFNLCTGRPAFWPSIASKHKVTF
jgi:hypothetical protein